jgi:hypothetical protein
MPIGSDNAVDAMATIGVAKATTTATAVPTDGEPVMRRAHRAASTTTTPRQAALRNRAAGRGPRPSHSSAATAAGNTGGNNVSGVPSRSAKPCPARRWRAAAR